MTDDGATHYDGGVLVFLLFLLFSPACGAQIGLEALQASMTGMRGQTPESGGPRGATAQLTVAKHQLRDWAESRLTGFAERGDEVELARRLTQELRDGGLICSDHRTDPLSCPDWSFLGFAAPVKMHRSAGFLILQTGVGIECGFDESAYVYGWSDGGWRRVWQNERNTYTEKEYQPQTIHSVLISPFRKEHEYLALVLGSQPWCSSNWRDVYYRAYRFGGEAAETPLVDEAALGFLDASPPIQGSISRDDVLVEFTTGSVDSGVVIRGAIRHYRIGADGAKRVDPLALSPRDFVDEWLTHDWHEASDWSEAAYRVSLAQRHKLLHKHSVSGVFLYPTKHCPSKPDLWQVGLDLSDPQTPIGVGAKPVKSAYFLVRWRPPYTFRLVQVSDGAFPGCTEEDRETDEARSRLFPVQ